METHTYTDIVAPAYGWHAVKVSHHGGPMWVGNDGCEYVANVYGGYDDEGTHYLYVRVERRNHWNDIAEVAKLCETTDLLRLVADGTAEPVIWERMA